MSSPHAVRRQDKVMTDTRAREVLDAGFCGRLGTVGADGWPYVVPLLYVVLDGEIHVHNTRAPGHLRRNIERDPRVCFEVDEAGEVFPYGRFECDTSIAYTSVIAFGTARIVTSTEEQSRFFASLMRKYANPSWNRPAEFFPRLDEITVYAIRVERLTGKETTLPTQSDRWPSKDNTKSPNAAPPRAR
jgi:nitroimidazol reductase NimA-like FMN-containing flavoprotein (pyridoxamine 5'-phosphate oxidase superfamily)